jgi:hypothetical protein
MNTVAAPNPMLLIVGAVLWCAMAPSLAQSLREQEMAQCRPGDMTTWGDGRDRPAVGVPLRFAYRHADAPP